MRQLGCPAGPHRPRKQYLSRLARWRSFNPFFRSAVLIDRATTRPTAEPV